jgi:Family of unknown function (DUF5677)
MHEYADERTRTAEVQKNFADLFRMAESLFNFWLTQEKDKWTANVPIASANLALILDVQACRLFRSVVEDCRRAEAFNAGILARTLFETTLGVVFLLKKDVRIIVEPIVPKCASTGTSPSKFAAKIQLKRTKRTRKHLLSREFRANLFLAYDYFLLEDRGIASMGKFPGAYQKAKKLKRSVDPNITAEIERGIGPEWSYILRHSNTYAGLSVRDLAKALDRSFLRWYETIYHFQSCAVHAVDFRKHIDVSDGINLKGLFLSSDRDVYQSLWSATGMFFAHMFILNKNLEFGTAANSAFQSLKRRFQEIAHSQR